MCGVLCCLLGCQGGSDDAPSNDDGSTASPPALRPDAPPIHFTNVTAETGIDLVITSGVSPSTQILEVKGGGLALIDIDDDGDLDLFVANGATLDDPEGGPGARLYENLGDLVFRDVTDDWGINHHRWSMGVAVGDADGDGRDDLFISCFGPNVLLRNTGTSFEDVTDQAGVGDPRWATGCAFGDIDGDDDLDLYVVNYLGFDPASPPRSVVFKGQDVLAGPRGLPAVHDILYENLGDGTFRDVASERGCRPGRAAYGLGVVILDFNGDGHQDIFVGNDSMANYLYCNEGDGSFRDVAMRVGVAASGDGFGQATMGIAIGDVNGDGVADVYSTNFSSDSNTMHVSAGTGWYDDLTRRYGLGVHSRPFLGWACGFYDFNHDGGEDLVVFNGHVYPQATMQTMDSPYTQTPLLYRRVAGRFERVTDGSGDWLDDANCDRSSVFGDLDGDGDVDIVVGELNGPVRILRNDTDDDAWVRVELRDRREGAGNHRGLGSRVVLRSGAASQTRWVHGGGSFQSSSAQAAFFGLPDPGAELTIVVTWPDGQVQTVDGRPGRNVVERR